MIASAQRLKRALLRGGLAATAVLTAEDGVADLA